MEDAKRHTSIRAHVIHEVIREEGLAELSRPSSALAWSGIAAGLSMAFSLIAEAAIYSRLPDVPYRPLLAKLGYPIGFLITIVGKQQLFTENTLTVVLPLMSRRDVETLLQMLRVWGVVLAANLLGAHVMAWCLHETHVLTPLMQSAIADIAAEAVGLSFGTVVIRGVFAGWLIALVVWLRAALADGGPGIVFVFTYVIAIGGFAHIVAGSTEVLYLVFEESYSWGKYLTGFFAPALLGNILGGVSLVAALNHAQVIAGSPPPVRRSKRKKAVRA